jgi:hypothetical protein
MRSSVFLLLLVSVFLSSCGLKVTTDIKRGYDPLDFREEVIVFGLKDEPPGDAILVGNVQVGDNGFTTKCGWTEVVEQAVMEARKAGGNAIKITEHFPPSVFGSSCHQITAKILKITPMATGAPRKPVEDPLLDADYALLHIYRPGGAGTLIAYDLQMEDTVICRVKSNFKTTIKIRKEGSYVFWARTESRSELPLSIFFGREYYIKCSIKMGAFVGQPHLELVEKEIGRAELQTIETKVKRDNRPRDILILQNETKIECFIIREDDGTLTYSNPDDEENKEVTISKSKIKEIYRH